MGLGLRNRWTLLRLVVVTGLVGVPLALSDVGPAAPGRDAVWREIFARPVAPPPPPSGTPAALRIDLGRDLFHDTRLSGDGTRSCASCHQPALGFTDGLATGEGRDGRPLKRNTPTLFNVGSGTHFFWDGRAESLEEQARGPLLAAAEMAGDFAGMIARLGSDAGMVRRFAAAFPDAGEISEAAILSSLAAYERTIEAPLSRFDHWVEGNDAALSAEEKQGFSLFIGRAGCVSCHGGWRFTDDLFHDIGLPGADPGRGALAHGVTGVAQFKTPGLRELLDTAPYMHDGSLVTLAAVVEHYSEGRIERASLDPNIVRDMRLSAEEKAQLVAFLKTLSSRN